jgi:hypothetical protein
MGGDAHRSLPVRPSVPLPVCLSVQEQRAPTCWLGKLSSAFVRCTRKISSALSCSMKREWWTSTSWLTGHRRCVRRPCAQTDRHNPKHVHVRGQEKSDRNTCQRDNGERKGRQTNRRTDRQTDRTRGSNRSRTSTTADLLRKEPGLALLSLIRSWAVSQNTESCTPTFCRSRSLNASPTKWICVLITSRRPETVRLGNTRWQGETYSTCTTPLHLNSF